MCPDALLSPEVKIESVYGYVVKASKSAPGAVVPPRRHLYWLEWRASLEEAADHYSDVERGEFDGWRPDGIYPADKDGLPIKDKQIGPLMTARLMQETA